VFLTGTRVLEQRGKADNILSKCGTLKVLGWKGEEQSRWVC